MDTTIRQLTHDQKSLNDFRGVVSFSLLEGKHAASGETVYLS